MRFSTGKPAGASQWGRPGGARKNKTPEADFQKELVSTLIYALPEPYAFFASMVGVNVGAFKGEELRAMGVRPDFPDINIINLDTGAWRGLECKSLVGTLSKGQKDLRDRVGDKWQTVKTLGQAQFAMRAIWGIRLKLPLRFANQYQCAMWERMTAEQKDREWSL